MGKVNRLKDVCLYLIDPKARYRVNHRIGLDKKYSDIDFLKLAFKMHMGYDLNLDCPQTYNEKLQWLKLYDQNEMYTRMVDKAEAKQIAASIIGDQYIIPTLGVFDSFDEIDFNALPDQFVIKCTHDSGGLVICKDKKKLDIDKARKKINQSLRTDYYKAGREWPYKNVKHKIIIEQYIEDVETSELRDYKFFCFGGVPKALFIATDRQKEDSETCFDFFDMDYNHLDIRHGHPNAAVLPRKPMHFEEMKILASKLSESIPHVRIDLYESNNRVYFGEFTFFHHSGFVPFDPEQWDKVFGDWLVLPKKK